MYTTKLAIECVGIHLQAGKDRINDDIDRQLILEWAGGFSAYKLRSGFIIKSR
jgi:hypothetical protein